MFPTKVLMICSIAIFSMLIYVDANTVGSKSLRQRQRERQLQTVSTSPSISANNVAGATASLRRRRRRRRRGQPATASAGSALSPTFEPSTERLRTSTTLITPILKVITPDGVELFASTGTAHSEIVCGLTKSAVLPHDAFRIGIQASSLNRNFFINRQLVNLTDDENKPGRTHSKAMWTSPLLHPMTPNIDSDGRIDFPEIIRVVGGRNALVDQIPWQAQLIDKRRSISDAGFCGGTIISPTFILTAGHCVADVATGGVNILAKDLSVLVGSLKYDSNPPAANDCAKLVGVKRIFLHPDWRVDFSSDFLVHNDIALLELAQPLDLRRPCIGQICLSRRTNVPRTNELTVASGYGCQTNDCSDRFPLALQWTQLRVVDDKASTCFGAARAADFLANINNTLCAGAQAGFDTCPGDSGGPLFAVDKLTLQHYQVGVTSYGRGDDGNPCGGVNAGKYTRVSTYIDSFIGPLVPDAQYI